MTSQSVCEALVKRWQSQLGLQDWELNVRAVSRKELTRRSGDESRAYVLYRLQYCRAIIYVLRAEDRDKDEATMEHSIVHELVHLLLAPFTRDLESGSIAQTVEEQVVNKLTRALTGFKFKVPK